MEKPAEREQGAATVVVGAREYGVAVVDRGNEREVSLLVSDAGGRNDRVVHVYIEELSADA